MNKFRVILVTILLFFVLALNVAIASETQETVISNVEKITLTGEGENITWSVVGYNPQGYRIIWSKDENPIYPLRTSDKSIYHADPDRTTETLSAFDGSGIYNIRVCESLEGECGVYSNEIILDLGDHTDVPINNINLKNNGGNSISWTTDGFSKNGFKIIWSKKSGPKYPIREFDTSKYLANPYANETELKMFDNSGIYYVRVCAYDGTECDAYSNEITIELGEKILLGTEDVKSIVLTANGKYLKWETEGYSEKGYAVVWSKLEDPEFPARAGIDKHHYFVSPSTDSDSISAFSGEGEYYVRVCAYLGGASCGVYSNQVKTNVTSEVVCEDVYKPVCGVDNRTYSNECVALYKKGVKIAYKAACTKDDDIIAIENKAELLVNNRIDEILSEINETKNVVKEQQIESKYLKVLLTGVSNVSSAIKNSINIFITYGIDDNTKRLGAGERAAVMYSYKNAFGKLPIDEDDLADAVKIANGRWPTMYSLTAEEKAKEKFTIIYKRTPDMDNANDEAAIKIMAYGLRQKPSNRNLNSEKNGINIFKGIFSHNPSNTEEWNIMQAITYSGATR